MSFLSLPAVTKYGLEVSRWEVPPRPLQDISDEGVQVLAEGVAWREYAIDELGIRKAQREAEALRARSQAASPIRRRSSV